MATATIVYNGYGSTSGSVAIYDASNNLLWSGTGAQIDTSVSAPWSASLTRSTGLLNDGTASISFNFPNTITSVTLSGGTAYEFDLTGHSSYTTDGDDYLIYSASNLPENITLTPLAVPSASCKASSAAKIVATFSAVENASSYLVRCGTTNPPTGDGSAITGGGAVSGLTADTTYYLQFKAVGDGTTYGDSDWSSAITCATLASGQLAVLNTNNSGEGSLRQAAADASSVTTETITFDPSLSGATITLSAQLEITKSLVIDGSALTDRVTISGGNTFTDGVSNNDGCRVVYCNTAAANTIVMKSLIIADGYSLNSDGAGIYNNGGTLRFEGCDITRNVLEGTTERWKYYGGGIFTRGNTTLIDCRITQNRALGGIDSGTAVGAGIIIVDHYPLTMIRSEVTGNIVKNYVDHAYAGGVYSGTSSLFLTNCLIADNIIESTLDKKGCGIYSWLTADWIHSGVEYSISNCTITGNQTSSSDRSSGAGIYIDANNNAAALNIDNSIVCGNLTGGEIYRPDCVVMTIHNSLTEADSSLPLFTDAANGDYTLPSNSQAINIGDTQYVGEETDLAGNPRIQGANPDAGAYEYQPAALLAAPTITPTISGTTASVAFPVVANAVGYRLQYGTDSTFVEKTDLAYVSGTAIPGLISGTTYYFRLQAISDGRYYGNSVWSAVGSTSTDSEPITLTAPVILAATPVSSSEVSLEWSETEHAVGYLLRYRENGTDGAFLYESFAPAAVSGNVASLTADTVWAFQIQAVGSGRYNDSDWSLAATAATPDHSSPISPTITLLGASSVLIPVGYFYIDPGASAADHYGRPLTCVLTGSVDTAATGVYLLTWSATDSDGLSSAAVRTVQVIETSDGEPAEPVWGITLGVC